MLVTRMIISAMEAGTEVMDSHHKMEENVQMRAEMERMGEKVNKIFCVYQKTLYPETITPDETLHLLKCSVRAF